MTESGEQKKCPKDEEKPGALVTEVLGAELTEIESSRKERLNVGELRAIRGDWNVSGEGSKTTGTEAKENEDSVYSPAHRSNLIGLAFSGGGIRSATFNLGVLQGLAEGGLLRFIDYLSTVSGGGYIGSWFVSWIAKNKSVKDVEDKLCVGSGSSCTFEEQREISFLRKYSNYLTPKKGFFGADTWAAISTYLRNLSLNLTVFIPLLIAILLFPAVAVVISQILEFNVSERPDMIFNVVLISLGIGVYFINLNLFYIPTKTPKVRAYPWYTKQGYILLVIVLPIMTSAFLGSLSIWCIRNAYSALKIVFLIKAILAYLFSSFAGILTANILNSFSSSNTVITRKVVVNTIGSFLSLSSFVSFLLTLSAGVGMAVFLYYIATLLKDDYTAIWYVTGFGMPLVIIAYMAAITIQIGFEGRNMPDEKREWWSRLGGWFFIFILLWTALFSIEIFGAPLLIWTSKFVSLPLIAGWLTASVSGILAGKGPNTGKPGSISARGILAKAAPYIFILGLLLFFYFLIFLFCIHISKTWDNSWDPLLAMKNFKWLVGTNLFYASYMLKEWPMNIDLFHASYTLTLPLLWIFLATLFVAALFSWRIDINQFSIHLLYRNRLIRCFLGASNQHRNPQPFIGFDTDDDFPLCTLHRDNKYCGPYPIINTTLNLVSGRRLAWQQRKAASFVLTPKYCGYDLPVEGNEGNRKSYMPTLSYDGSNGMSIGEAMAISGAAASPNMGFHSSPPLTFLMTIFNLRLGWWCGNTVYEKAWKKSSPIWGLRYLIKELFGLTDRESKYVYLSDGGHFENLGIYELVRRRCRLIIVSDAGCDPEKKFEDIGNAIRKIRVDLGIPIDIDLSLIETSKAHCIKGIIRYTSVDKGKGVRDGALIYIKPVICGMEPADVVNYRLTHDDFPHQSTADQWFDESQFESYRMLGLHSIRTLCGSAWKGKNPFDFCEQVDNYLDEIKKQMVPQDIKSSEKPS